MTPRFSPEETEKLKAEGATPKVGKPIYALVTLLPLVWLPMDWFGRWVRQSVRSSLDSNAHLAASAQESFVGIRVVQVFGAEQQRSLRFRKLLKW